MLFAGFVDAVGWLLLFRLFTAHMSGNTVAAGIRLARGQWSRALFHGFPIPCFFVGVVSGAALSEWLIRKRHPSVFFPSLALEGILLLILALGARAGLLQRVDTPLFYLMGALPALAMGLQNATIRYVGKLTVRTTFITGILTGCAEALVAYCFWVGVQRKARHPWSAILRHSLLQRSCIRALLFAALWVGYLAGAVLGVFLQDSFAGLSLLVPAAGLFAFAALDLLHPLSTPRRREQLLHGTT